MGDLLNVDMNYLIGKKESTEIIPDSYYLNPEARDMAQFLFENPEYKVLFDASRKVKPEDIQFVKEMIAPCSYAETVEYPVKALYTFVTCSYEINDARTFLFAVEADEQGNEITADEEDQQKMTDLMIKKAEEAEAVSKEAGKK